jgi:rhamnosyltransferase
MIYAITISYNPILKNLQTQIEKLLPQVDKIILVDNGSTNQTSLKSLFSKNKIFLILLPDNFGIAEAQNIGIKTATEDNVDHIIFFDQDSIPEDNLVTKLLEISTNYEIIDNKPNMVGPVSQDIRTGRNSYFLVKKSLGFINQFCNDNHSRAIECNFLISSGSLISSKIFEKIGNFRSDFFIDHVDTEFCTRMENAGFKMYGTCSTKIYHNLGDRIQKIWFGRWREISIHSPLRNYYMSRNTIYMTLYLPINLLWKIRIMRRLISYLIYSLFFTSPRRFRLKLFLLGAKHGFFKKLGKLKID